MSIPKPQNSHVLRDHFAYFNLHNRVYSLKCLQTDEALRSAELLRIGQSGKGRVTCHAESIVMIDTITRVSESGRQRVIREKRKNVHAGIIGSICVVNPVVNMWVTSQTPRIHYNPYYRGYFCDYRSRTEVRNPPVVWLTLDKSGRDGPVARAYYGSKYYIAGNTAFLNSNDLFVWALSFNYSGPVHCTDGTCDEFVDGRYRCSYSRTTVSIAG